MSQTKTSTAEQAATEQAGLNELMSRLDEIVAWFNSGDIDIDQATHKFDEGVKLAEQIKSRLAETDTKINQIKLKLEQATE